MQADGGYSTFDLERPGWAVDVFPVVDGPSGEKTREQSGRLEQMVARQAARTPHSPAILHRDTVYTYQQMERRSNQLARLLSDRGYGQGAVIGVCHSRSADLIIIILAVLKAGAAYLPLAPDYPDGYLQGMITDCRPAAIVTQMSLLSRFAGLSPCLALDAEAPLVDAQSAEALPCKGHQDDLAQVIYTSGSTGAPKGVMLAHTARHLLSWAKGTYRPDELAQVAATTSICFDPSILEIFLPLTTGGTILLKQDALEPFGPGEEPTMLTSVPSVLSALADADAIPASVKVINSGGERLTPSLIDQLFRQSKAHRIFNHYGPTETSICVAASVAERDGSRDVSRLKALADVRLYVLDARREPVATGDCGELYVGGPMVAKGYLNQPEMTAERFLLGPLGEADASGGGDGRLYRTGDLVRKLSAREVQFVGRCDEQVKIRGYRVELGAVEASLAALPGVRAAVASVETTPEGENRLTAWLETDAELSLREVRRTLCATLPSHMIPTQVRRLAKMPLTPSGKIDRKAVPLASLRPHHPQEPRAEMGPYERLVASAFETVLSADSLEADDDFFDLGGTSLSALRAMARIEALIGCPIDVGLIFSERTPRRLGSAIALQERGGASHAIALQPRGEEPALFCSSDFHGLPTSYLALAERLAPDRPVYVLSPGPLRAQMIARPSIETLTRAYLREVRRLQPEGPYHVCGYSAGAATALALATALEEQGETVSLSLLDPIVSWKLPSLSFTRRWLIEHVAPVVKEVGLIAAARRIQRIRHMLLRPQRVLTLKNVPKGTPARERRLARAMLQAEISWRFRPFGGPATVVQSSSGDPAESYINFDGLNGLADLLTGPVARLQLAAGHVEMMQQPHVDEVARHLRRYI